MNQEGHMGQNKPSCSFPRVETIANRFLVIFHLRKVTFGRPKTPATKSSVFWLDFAHCAAYDTVDREQLWQGKHEYGFPDKLTRLIKATLDRVMCYVRVSGVLADPFESRRGLRQGDGLSCALFNIALKVIVQRAGIDTKGTIFTKSVQLLGFADDIDIIMARNLATTKETYTRLKAEAIHLHLHGLEYNENKIYEGKGVENWEPCLSNAPSCGWG